MRAIARLALRTGMRILKDDPASLFKAAARKGKRRLQKR